MNQHRSPGRTAPRKKRRKSKAALAIRPALVCSVVVLSLGLGVAAYLLARSPVLRQATGVALTGGLSPAKAFPGRSDVNVLLLGKDQDRDRRDRVLKTRGRTDAIVVAHFDFQRHLVNLLSIPRDTLVRIPGVRGRHKINAANQYGGPELTAQTIDNLLGVRSGGYLLVNYGLFAKLIDQIGGVSVTVDKPLNYDDNWGGLHIHLKPGLQHLDGQQALGLVRYRKSNDGRGDPDQMRIGRQQMLIASARAQIMKPANIVRLPEIISTVLDNSKTTLSVPQALCLANFGREIGRDRIRMEVLPARPHRSALRMDVAKARALVDQLFFYSSPGGQHKSG